MNRVLTICSLLILTAGIISCEKDCPDQDVDDLNAIYLDFKLNGNNAFTPDQLNDIFMVRFQTDTLDTLSFQADTFLYYQEGFYADDFKIRISRTLPAFEQIGAPYYSAYNYSIQSTTEDFEILLTNIELVGSYDDENCIYTNSQKAKSIYQCDQYLESL